MVAQKEIINVMNILLKLIKKLYRLTYLTGLTINILSVTVFFLAI